MNQWFHGKFFLWKYLNNRLIFFSFSFQKLLSIPGASHSWLRWLFSPAKPYTLGKQEKIVKFGFLCFPDLFMKPKNIFYQCSKSHETFPEPFSVSWWINSNLFSHFPFTRSTTCNFYVVFPFILNSITLAGLYYLPKKMRLFEPHLPDCDDENSELLKKIGNFKKRRLQSKQKNN